MRWPPPPDWPMAELSRQVLVRPHRWHVQEAGGGPSILLIHGAGGATQSWRGLFPLLTPDHHVVAVDLPGQGFTQSGAQRRLGLQEMASDLIALARAQAWRPERIIGHSAGAAIALEMARQGFPPAREIVGVNAALSPFKGVAGWLFPMLAKALALTPLSADLFAATATPASVERLVTGTGSTLGPDGRALYHRLARDAGHVDATLNMMAQWELQPLLDALARIHVPVHLIVGDRDQAVPPKTSEAAQAALPDARLTRLAGLGHLAHEEDPSTVLSAIRA